MASDASISTRTVVLGSVRRDGSLDAGEVYAVAAAFGMTDLQVRLCLRRLVAEGVLHHVSGRGRRAEFTAAGVAASAIMPELEYVDLAYRQDGGLEPWDGRWRLVGFSVAETRRAARDELRNRLRYYGGATVLGGLYVSPHAWDGVIRAEAERIGVADDLIAFETDQLRVGGISDPRALAARLWPLDEVAEGYRAFMRALEARMDPDRTAPDAVVGDALATAIGFARAMEPDPLLPPELLPDGWAGKQARRALADAQRAVAALGLEERLPPLFDRLGPSAA